MPTEVRLASSSPLLERLGDTRPWLIHLVVCAQVETGVRPQLSRIANGHRSSIMRDPRTPFICRSVITPNADSRLVPRSDTKSPVVSTRKGLCICSRHYESPCTFIHVPVYVRMHVPRGSYFIML